jgi:hypothetical protein
MLLYNYCFLYFILKLLAIHKEDSRSCLWHIESLKLPLLAQVVGSITIIDIVVAVKVNVVTKIKIAFIFFFNGLQKYVNKDIKKHRCYRCDVACHQLRHSEMTLNKSLVNIVLLAQHLIYNVVTKSIKKIEERRLRHTL